MKPDDPPWRVLVPLADVCSQSKTVALAPDAAALARIARSLGLDQLLRLAATVSVSSWLDGVSVSGRWSAAVVQTCGVSLEPFETELEGEFEVKAVPAGSAVIQPPLEKVEIDLESDDPPDVLQGDSVDVGDYVVEHLGMEIDPFPRKPGATFEPPPAEAPPSPFAVLARLKRD